MGWIEPQLSFYKDCFVIKYPTKVDISLNNETKPSAVGVRFNDTHAWETIEFSFIFYENYRLSLS